MKIDGMESDRSDFSILRFPNRKDCGPNCFCAAKPRVPLPDLLSIKSPTCELDGMPMFV